MDIKNLLISNENEYISKCLMLDFKEEDLMLENGTGVILILVQVLTPYRISQQFDIVIKKVKNLYQSLMILIYCINGLAMLM